MRTPQRRVPRFLAAATASGTLLAAGGLAPTASAAPGDLFGKDTNQFGTTTLRFSRGFVTITLSPRLAKSSAGRSFKVRCRRQNQRYYYDVAGTVPFSARRTIRMPANPPDGIVRCRVRRSNKLVVAAMNVQRL